MDKRELLQRFFAGEIAREDLSSPESFGIAFVDDPGENEEIRPDAETRVQVSYPTRSEELVITWHEYQELIKRYPNTRRAAVIRFC